MRLETLSNRSSRRRLLGCLFGLSMFVFASRTPVEAEDALAKLPWAENLEAGLDQAAKQSEAKQGNGLVVVVVSEGQCAYCEWIDERLFNQPPVVDAARPFVFVRERVGLDETGVMHDSMFAKQRQSEFTPGFYVLDSSGELVDRFWGATPPEEFAARLKHADEQFRNFPELKARLEKHPDDLGNVGLYAAALAARGKRDEAIELVNKAEGGTPKAELAPAYNRIGDTYFQGLPGAMCELYGSFDVYDDGAPDAARWFRKTVESSQDPELVAYARFGLGMCFRAQNMPAELAAQHEAIRAMPDAPKHILERIKNFN